MRARSYAADFGELLTEHRDRMKATVVWNIEQGLRLTDEDANRARALLADIRRRAAAFFDRFDYLVQPVSQVAPFDPRDSVATATLIAQGRLMALPIAPDASPPAGHTVYAERLDLRIGLSFTEVWELVLRRRFDLLVQRLVIIE